MKPVDILIIAVITLAVGLAIWYIHRAKKKGAKCIGCPDGTSCSGACSGCAGNCGAKKEK